MIMNPYRETILQELYIDLHLTTYSQKLYYNRYQNKLSILNVDHSSSMSLV
jgi:hypothetical protein